MSLLTGFQTQALPAWHISAAAASETQAHTKGECFREICLLLKLSHTGAGTNIVGPLLRLRLPTGVLVMNFTDEPNYIASRVCMKPHILSLSAEMTNNLGSFPSMVSVA